MSGPGFQQATLLLIATLTVMAGATIAPALPAIAARYGQTPGADVLVGLVLTAPALAIVAAAPLWGRLTDRIGRKAVLLPAIGVYTVAGAAGLLIDNLVLLLTSRLALGLAVGAVMTASTALMADLFEGEARRRLIAMQAAFTGFGGFVFLTIGGMLADLSWRGPFAVYLLAVPVLGLALIVFGVRDPNRATAPSDAVRTRTPLTRSVWTLSALAATQSFVFYLIPARAPFLLQGAHEASATQTGLIVGACVLTSALTSLALSVRRTTLTRRRLLVGGFGALGIGLAGVAVAPGAASMLAAFVIAGFGMGLLLPTLMTAALAGAPEDVRGRISGVMTAGVFLRQFVSPLFAAPVASAGGDALAFSLAAFLSFLAAAFVAGPARLIHGEPA